MRSTTERIHNPGLNATPEGKKPLSAVFRIHDILIRIKILRFIHWITDPDPDLFFSGFPDANKKYVFFLLLTGLYLLVGSTFTVHVHQSSMITNHTEVIEKWKSRFSLIFLLRNGRIRNTGLSLDD